MKTYTEEEALKLIQFIVSNEELENTSSIHISTAKRYLEDFNELQDDYIEEPKYFAVFDTLFQVDLEALPDKNTSWKNVEEMIKQVNSLPLTFSAEKEIKTAEPVKIPISKETKDFLERHCNIERNVVGEDTYVLNNLRFKIIEE
jgi:hypothetical protein